MKFPTAYGPDRLGLSFELFPPKSPADDAELFRNLDALMSFRPSYVTCTYGAGGSTRHRTLEILERVRTLYGCTIASHLTCVGATTDELRQFLNAAVGQGIQNIVALRGDPPRGDSVFRPVEGGLCYANELVALIRGCHPELGIAVAGYPETHRDATSPESDLENLKRKVDAGADVVITQVFFSNDDFFRFRDRYVAAGIKAPLVPGILPVTSLAQVRRITSMCAASLPPSLESELAPHSNDPEAQHLAGVSYSTRQVQQLVENDVPGLHFYVLNKSAATASVLRDIQLPRSIKQVDPAPV